MSKEYSTEQIFDMLPYAVEIYEKIDFDGYRKKLQAKYKGKKIDPTDAGIDAFKFVLKNSSKVKEEFFQLVAIAENKTVEEVRNQNFIETIKTIKEIFSNKELVDFFK